MILAVVVVVILGLIVMFGGALGLAYLTGLSERKRSFFDLMDWAYDKGKGKK